MIVWLWNILWGYRFKSPSKPLMSSGSWLTMHNCEIYYLSAVNSDPTITDLILSGSLFTLRPYPHNTNRGHNFFCIVFGGLEGFGQCCPFCVFERCLDSNPESCRIGRHQLSHPFPTIYPKRRVGGYVLTANFSTHFLIRFTFNTPFYCLVLACKSDIHSRFCPMI